MELKEMESRKMQGPLSGLEPCSLWEHFAHLCRIPRPSKHEAAVAKHVWAWAEAKGFSVNKDTAGNLLVRVAATGGLETAPTVVLQSHLDMVGEKNRGVEHDFKRDPITPRVDGEWVRAQGTTLGADNGIGVAAAMAVAEEPRLEHGPLELLFTLDEETGLNGARALDPDLVEGRLLINLDSEEDGALYIGCAGAGGLQGSLPLKRTPTVEPGRRLCELTVQGLVGGHSGMDIVHNLGNALKILAHLLGLALDQGIDFGLVSIDGGDKGNAIPRESRALLTLDETGRAALERLIESSAKPLALEFGAVAPSLRLRLQSVAAEEATPWPPVTGQSREGWIRFVQAFPDGVWAMSREVAGLVETSSNLASLTTAAEAATFLCSCRSSVDAALAGQLRSLMALCGLAGVQATARVAYPGWPPCPALPIVQRAVAVHEKVLGFRPEVKAIHAGLECGVLVEKLLGLDAVSIGPEIRAPHSPDERVHIASVARFYKFFLALLEDLSGLEPVP